MLNKIPTYSKDNLPGASDPRWENWRKRPVIVRMMPLQGPARIITIDAPTDLPDDWEDWLVIDANGHPYPLHRDVHAQIYIRDSVEFELETSAVNDDMELEVPAINDDIENALNA